VIHRIAHARAVRPGVAVSALVLALASAFLVTACGTPAPEIPTTRRAWEGGDQVASEGVVIYDRREIAQRVPLPACITVGEDRFRFIGVTPFAGGTAPPGLDPTLYRIDRWSLWKRPGPLEGQPVVYVTVRGSSGLLAEYHQVGVAESCGG
jgi:hypothetical protein